MSPQFRRPPIYIAMETKAREMEAKILLSAVLALRGFRVVLGYKADLDALMETMPPGIYIDKSAASTKTEKFHFLRNQGHAVMTHDEEGLVIHNPQRYLSHRVDASSVEALAQFFMWGSEQADIIRGKYPQYAAKLEVTGNPRFDLLRQDFRTLFEEEKERLRNRYGPYILIATKFGTHNNQKGGEAYLQSQVESGLIKTDDDYDFRKGYFAFQEQVFHHFVELVTHVSRRNSDRTIVVRPHPSENLATWQSLVGHLPNVSVVRDGNVQPWILAAKLLVHNGCTTAIEATLLGVPAVAYRPVKSERFDIPLPNALSIEAATLEKLDQLVAEILGGANCNPTPEQTTLLQRHLTGTTGPSASDRIANAIERFADSATLPPPALARQASHEVRRLMRSGRAILRGVVGSLPHVGGRVRKTNPKFPGMTISEVRAFLGKLATVESEFLKVSARRYDRNCAFLTVTEK